MKRQSGFSLSEMLISLFLASLIVISLMQFYLTSKNQYKNAEEVLAAEFDLSWISDLMADSVRRAGFTPCLGIEQLHVKDRGVSSKTIKSIQIENYPQQYIHINRMSEYFSKVERILNATQLRTEALVLSNSKHPLIIADCEHAEIHRIFSIQANNNHTFISLAKPLQFSYSSSVYIGEWIEERWFIKRNSKGEHALYYGLSHAEEISSLIQSLNIHQQKIGNKQFIKIIMGLVSGKKQSISVAVRDS